MGVEHRLSRRAVFPRVPPALTAWSLFLSGVLLSVAFDSGFSLPTQTGVLLLAVAWIVLTALTKLARPTLLGRFMLLLYFAPFSSLLALVFIRDFAFFRNDLSLPLALDDSLIAEMLTVGIIGLLGLGAGLFSAEAVVPESHDVPGRHVPRLGPSWFIAMLAAGLGALVLSSGSTSLAAGSYFLDALDAASAGKATSSLSVLGYALVVALFVDARLAPIGREQSLKQAAVLAVLALYGLVFQIMRGDRESIGLLTAVGVLYLTVGREAADSKTMVRRLGRVAPVAVVVLVLFLAIGRLRTSTSTSAPLLGAAVSELAAGGTWTAVLLGNLGVAEEHKAGAIRYLHGDTYLGYLKNLPPRPLAQLIGYERDNDPLSAPGLWYYPLQIGGVHPVLVPFRNFGVYGVLGVLTFFGLLIGTVERQFRRSSWRGSFLYGVFFANSFWWFWYGDMPFIRGLMAALMVWFAYAAAVQLSEFASRLSRLRGAAAS